MEIDTERDYKRGKLENVRIQFFKIRVTETSSIFLTRELSSHVVFCFASDLSAFLSQLKHEETNSRTRLLFSGTSPMWKKSWLGYETRSRWLSLTIWGAPLLVRDRMKY